jgi:hypothetical protein
LASKSPKSEVSPVGAAPELAEDAAGGSGGSGIPRPLMEADML